MDLDALKDFIVAVIDEEFAPHGVELGSRWQGGSVTLQPGNDSQAKEIPIEVLFKKLITVREALRVLEQKINTHAQLSSEEKLTFQGYISRAYGSLTTFNILFKDGKDKFVGAGEAGKGSNSISGSKSPKMSLSEAKKKLGLNEYE